MEYLRAAIPDCLQYLLSDMFEKRTLYSNRTTEADYRQLPDGRYEVSIEVKVSKFYADSLGHETITDFNDWIDGGVLTKAEAGKKNNRSYTSNDRKLVLLLFVSLLLYRKNLMKRDRPQLPTH